MATGLPTVMGWVNHEGQWRGKYYERIKASSNVVVLDDEVAAYFPNSAAVNKALHSIVDVAQKASAQARRTTGRGKQRRTG